MTKTIANVTSAASNARWIKEKGEAALCCFTTSTCKTDHSLLDLTAAAAVEEVAAPQLAAAAQLGLELELELLAVVAAAAVLGRQRECVRVQHRCGAASLK